MSAPVVKNTGPVLAGFNLRTATATVTNAQIKTLPSTPVTLVAAPGATKMLLLVGYVLRCLSTAAGYTGISATYAALSISYLDNAGGWAALPAVNSSTATPTITNLTTLLGTSDNAVFGGPFLTSDTDEGYVTPFVLGSSGLLDQPLVICMDNNGSPTDLGGGNAANSMVITLIYTEV